MSLFGINRSDTRVTVSRFEGSNMGRIREEMRRETEGMVREAEGR